MVEAMDFGGRLEQAEEFVSALSRGRDPLRSMRGDLRLAYRSGADRELVPFCILVPGGYNPRERYPLVVALHGAGETRTPLWTASTARSRQTRRNAATSLHP